MIYPSINELMKRIDSRYTLVIATAKRARQLNDGGHKLTDCDSDKSVTIAVHEIAEGKITYERKKKQSGEKPSETGYAIDANDISDAGDINDNDAIDASYANNTNDANCPNVINDATVASNNDSNNVEDLDEEIDISDIDL